MKKRLMTIVLAVSMLWHAGPAAAVDKDPLDYPLRQYIFLLAVALLGGLVSWYAKLRAGTVAAWNITQLVGELATSAFAGLLAFWACAYMEMPPLVTAALVGVAGHMGTRGIAVAEAWASRRFGTTLELSRPAATTVEVPGGNEPGS